MRILTGLLAIALLAAWGPITPAAAQGATAPKAAKAKPAKAAAKKAKQPAKDMYMRSAS